MSSHIELMLGIMDAMDDLEKSDEQKYWELAQEYKAQILDIENSLIDMLVADKTHKDRDLDLKRLIAEIRNIRRKKNHTIDEIPF